MSVVALVNPPLHQSDLEGLSPPLGLMVLASLAGEAGFDAHIIDFSIPFGDEDDPSSFYPRALRQILDTNPAVVCFTSMGVNSHVSLELARLVKQAEPSVAAWVGGVHFSSIATELEAICPWIDAVFVGEAEEPFRSELSNVRNGTAIATRTRLLRAHDDAPRIFHPHSSYDLIPLDEYFKANPRRVVNYEGGRGCVFKCAFCYSPQHFHEARDVPPSQIVEDWAKLATLGVGHVFMVQDNFTNFPRHVIETCDALAAADLPIEWNGYATLPQLIPTVCEALGRARCRQIYLGVDAVTPLQRVRLNKRFFKSDEELLSRLRSLMDAGVAPTCAFMLDLFSFDENEVEIVLSTAAECAGLGASIRLNSLTRYPATALGPSIRGASRYSEGKVELSFDCPTVVKTNRFAQLCPSAFPFHSTENQDEADWRYGLRLVRLAQRLIQAFPDYFRELAKQPDNAIVRSLDRLVRGTPDQTDLELADISDNEGLQGELF